MIIQIITTVLKTIAKYGAKQAIRRIGVFGLTGSAKKIIKSTSKTKTLMNLLKKNVLKQFGKVNFIIEIKKEGFSYALKRLGASITPMELKKLYYFLKPIGKNAGDIRRINQDKKKVWKKLEKMSMEDKAKTLDKLVRSKPQSKEDEINKKELLNHTFWFRVKSPETGNFSKLPQYANISKRTYGVPIKGILNGGMLKYYSFDKLGAVHWSVVKQAMTTNDYGHEVYSKIRKPLTPSRKYVIWMLLYKI